MLVEVTVVRSWDEGDTRFPTNDSGANGAVAVMRLLRRESRVRNVFSTALWSLTIYRQRIGSREFPCGSGGGRLMDWTRRCIDDAHASQPRRPISAILAVAGVVLLTVAGAGCGHSAGASNIAAGGNGSGCPTQGVGGDTLAPPCPSPAGGTDGGADGISGPQTAPNSANSSPGIAGPVTAPAVSPSSPGLGITPPETPSITPPETPTPSVPPPQQEPPSSTPQVTAVFPSTGAAAGGDSVTISGSGFTGATQVDFGGVIVVITAISDTAITVTSPPGSGTVDITVVTPNGTSLTSTADQFTYGS